MKGSNLIFIIVPTNKSTHMLRFISPGILCMSVVRRNHIISICSICIPIALVIPYQLKPRVLDGILTDTIKALCSQVSSGCLPHKQMSYIGSRSLMQVMFTPRMPPLLRILLFFSIAGSYCISSKIWKRCTNKSSSMVFAIRWEIVFFCCCCAIT